MFSSYIIYVGKEVINAVENMKDKKEYKEVLY
jgi:hypothetical protein